MLRKRLNCVKASILGVLASAVLTVGCASVSSDPSLDAEADKAVSVRPAESTLGAGGPSPRRAAPQTGPLPNTSSPGAACSIYNATNMADMTDLAFDGTVVEVRGSAFRPSLAVETTTVDFQVDEWFDGGSQQTIRVMVPTARSIDATAPPFDVGTRLLVSGFTQRASGPPGDYAAGCGFTRYYEPAVAEEWRLAEASVSQ